MLLFYAFLTLKVTAAIDLLFMNHTTSAKNLFFTMEIWKRRRKKEEGLRESK